jgi:hypothetical protein
LDCSLSFLLGSDRHVDFGALLGQELDTRIATSRTKTNQTGTLTAITKFAIIVTDLEPPVTMATFPCMSGMSVSGSQTRAGDSMLVIWPMMNARGLDLDVQAVDKKRFVYSSRIQDVVSLFIIGSLSPACVYVRLWSVALRGPALTNVTPSVGIE